MSSFSFGFQFQDAEDASGVVMQKEHHSVVPISSDIICNISSVTKPNTVPNNASSNLINTAIGPLYYVNPNDSSVTDLIPGVYEGICSTNYMALGLR